VKLRLAFAHLIVALALAGVAVGARADEAALGPGARIETLVVGHATYHQVVVRSVNAHTVVFLHAGGMTSVRLRDLPAEWQVRFHFDPARELPESEPVASPVAAHHATTPHAGRRDVRIDDVLQRFGQPATVRPDVDLRPKFFELDLSVKNQGRRPSCAVFAVVSALEFQNAELGGKPEKFSEEYLIWATRHMIHRVPIPGASRAGDDDADEGFTLFEVANALRTFGIPLQATMPDTFGHNVDLIEEPPAAVVDEARSHQRVFVHLVPGRDAPTAINNIVQALNAGLPVAIGMSWPNFRSLRNGFLDLQKPQAGAGHAVTLVGYTCASGQLKDVVFIFKNSYGVQWGQGGYGTVTYNYLSNNLTQAVLLEVQGG
jgi:hypothetical protein